MENITTSYACSPSAFSGAHSGVRSTHVAGTWTASALGLGRSGVIMTPVLAAIKGTGVSVAAMRDKATAQSSARTTALLPISDVVAVKGDNGFAGIRSWSPPV